MKGKWTLLGSILAMLLLALAVGLARAQEPQPPQGSVGIQAALGTAFTYQGQLKKGGSPISGTCDFQFSLWDEAGSGSPPTGGNRIGITQTATISVTNGLFTAQIDFGSDAFRGDARWLQIGIKCAGDANYVTLSPRQPLTPAPYALALPGLWTQQNLYSPNIIGGYSGNSVTAGVYGATIGGGGSSDHTNVITDAFSTVGGGRGNIAGKWGATIAGGMENKAPGESSAIGGGNGNTASAYVATVSGGGANTASADGATVGGGMHNNSSGGQATIGGGHANTASGYAATIGGGERNMITATHGTIAGGYNITVTGQYAVVGGGYSNTASGKYATIGGGFNNTANSEGATIGGGESNLITDTAAYGTIGGGSGNTASGSKATVGGGSSNTASNWYATVGGGWNNTASGYAATVPGGRDNTAQGTYSFAAGYRAKANNQGCFVWGDSTNADVTCNTNNAFIIRANGGIWFGTATASITPTIGSGVFISTSTGAYLSTGGQWTNASDRNAKENFTPVDGREILERLAAIPITFWNYRAEGAGVRHIGPTAQDFHAAFGVGTDDTHIGTVDADGVALAAIQGLYGLVQEKDARIAELEKRVTALEAQNAAQQAQIDDLEARLAALEQRVGGSAPAQASALPVYGLALGGLAILGAVVYRRREGGGQ